MKTHVLWDVFSYFCDIFPSLQPLCSCHPEIPLGCQCLSRSAICVSLLFFHHFYFSVFLYYVSRDLLIFVIHVILFSSLLLRILVFCFHKSATKYLISMDFFFFKRKLFSFYESQTLTSIWRHQKEFLKAILFNIWIRLVFHSLQSLFGTYLLGYCFLSTPRLTVFKCVLLGAFQMVVFFLHLGPFCFLFLGE